MVKKMTEHSSPASEVTILSIVGNKSVKAKERVAQVSLLLLENKITIGELLSTAKPQSGATKGTLIEAMEFASRTNPNIVDEKAFCFLIDALRDDAPRVKWEAAKVIANTAPLFPKLVKNCVPALLDNSEHSGNVVRWSAATALSKIILLNTALNKELIPAVEAIIRREEDNAVRKIYANALKKLTDKK